MQTLESIVVVIATGVVAAIGIAVHPEPFREIHRKSKLRAVKITTVGGESYWQIQKRIRIIKRWVNAVEYMSLYYEPLRFDKPRQALDFIEAHYATEQERQNMKPIKK